MYYSISHWQVYIDLLGKRSSLVQRRLRPRRTAVTPPPSPSSAAAVVAAGELALVMMAGWSRRHRTQPGVQPELSVSPTPALKPLLSSWSLV